MLCFLNNNAPAIQALSAVATLVLTGFLAYFTHKYVVLTAKIAEAAQKQTQAVEDARFGLLRRKASALFALSLRIRHPLVTLNQSNIDLDELRRYSQLNAEDVSELQNLAAEVSTAVVGLAAQAAISLRGLLGTITKANTSAPGTHWRYTSQDVDRWTDDIADAQATLVKLEDAVRSALLQAEPDIDKGE